MGYFDFNDDDELRNYVETIEAQKAAMAGVPVSQPEATPPEKLQVVFDEAQNIEGSLPMQDLPAEKITASPMMPPSMPEEFPDDAPVKESMQETLKKYLEGKYTDDMRGDISGKDISTSGKIGALLSGFGGGLRGESVTGVGQSSWNNLKKDKATDLKTFDDGKAQMVKEYLMEKQFQNQDDTRAFREKKFSSDVDFRDKKFGADEDYRDKTMNFNERGLVQKTEQARLKAMVEKSKDVRESTMRLRKEYNNDPIVKDTKDLQQAFGKIQKSATTVSPAGDLALIFNFMKMLDPGSTVREGEFANAQNSGSAFEKVGGLYNQIMNGKRLTDVQRQDFLGQSKNIYQTQIQQLDSVNSRYSDISGQYGIDQKDVLMNPYQFSAAGAKSSGTGGSKGSKPGWAE